MASDNARIAELEELVAYLVLNMGNAKLLPYWRNDPVGLLDAVRDWLLAAQSTTSTDAALTAAAKNVRQ